MSLRVVWDYQALTAFYRLHPSTAERVDRAVHDYAEKGVGAVRWWPPFQRLRAGSRHEVAVRVDREAGELHVIYLYEASA